jgi:hypothetical protein
MRPLSLYELGLSTGDISLEKIFEGKRIRKNNAGKLFKI